METVRMQNDDVNAFTVINNEEKREPAVLRNVNVVKPLQIDGRLPGAKDQPEKMVAAISPQTILDPKFSRALDFKLRRLKEKEILEANLRRPTRRRPNGLTTSNPNIHWTDQTPPMKAISKSNPRVNLISSESEKIKISNIEKFNYKNRLKQEKFDVEKPRFMTTVKTGQFLLPPPEVASLLGLETLYPPQDREKIVYSYSNKPKAVATRSKRSITEKKKELTQQPNVDKEKMYPGEAFRNVRALIAGVAGVKHLLEERDKLGSMATAQGTTTYSNVMHDKRVVRGSTFATHLQAAGDGIESNAARAARTRRRALARRAALARLRPGTPPPAPGRAHHPIQTDHYLEELFDKGVEMEVGVQTDLFVDRPASPLYVPARTGADACTQIYPGDLFDFDLEVQPILEVLVGKTVEQALAEVAQEEELGALREQQRRYRELRDTEKAERQRLEMQDTRIQEEKERRVAESAAAARAAVEARQRVAATALVRGYVADLLPAALAGLRDSGYLVRRVQRGVEEEFMPWLIQEVSMEIESIITSRDVITEIVREVMEARSEFLNIEVERTSPPESITPPSVDEEEGVH